MILRKLSFRCVEMSPFSSGKLSAFCLFSYTFRLPTSFINIFFSVSPPRHFPSSTATMEPPPCGLICPAILRAGLGIHLFLRATWRGGRVPSSSYPNPSPGVLSIEISALFLPVGKNFTNSFHFFLPVGNPGWRASDIQLSWLPLTLPALREICRNSGPAAKPGGLL